MPFGIVMAIMPTWQFNWVVGAIVGAIVSLAISYIFLRGARERIATDIAERRHRTDQRTDTDKADDAELDARGGTDEADHGAPPATRSTP